MCCGCHGPFLKRERGILCMKSCHLKKERRVEAFPPFGGGAEETKDIEKEPKSFCMREGKEGIKRPFKALF